jgi:hypothetical protein
MGGSIGYPQEGADVQFSGKAPTRLLVRGGVAFYNPSIAALVAVLSFTHHPRIEESKRIAVRFASKCMDTDPHFGNSQEH